MVNRLYTRDASPSAMGMIPGGRAGKRIPLSGGMPERRLRMPSVGGALSENVSERSTPLSGGAVYVSDHAGDRRR
jgi:hypothetical protein